MIAWILEDQERIGIPYAYGRNWVISLRRDSGWRVTVNNFGYPLGNNGPYTGRADTPEEALAIALLQILVPFP